MPVFINEVIAEVSETGVPESKAHPPPQQAPMSLAEFEMVQTLAILEQRRERLRID